MSRTDDDAMLFRKQLEKAHTDIAEQVRAFLAGEHARANTGPCAALPLQSDEERGPRPDVQ